jgi:hypothetical protein
LRGRGTYLSYLSNPDKEDLRLRPIMLVFTEFGGKGKR